ncbi:MAG: AzlC family ABC transporter permease [Pseudomonadota bacterium]
MTGSSLFGGDASLAALRRASFVRGVRAVAPALLATGVWGLVTGVAMVKTGLTEWQALGMTLLVFAGTAQMAALPLVAADAPVWVVLAAATVVNLRFVIFSATLWPYLRRFPLHKRLLLGYVTADIAAAVFVARYAQAPDDERGRTEQVWFLLGVTTAIWLVWQAGSITGIFVAGTIPGAWGLDFAAILALLGLTLPMINSRPALAGAAVAAVVAVVAVNLPLKLGVVAAVIAGTAVAMATDIALDRARSAG